MYLTQKFIFFILLSSCAISPNVKNTKPSTFEDDVSLSTALRQAQNSYLLGCVETFQSLRIAPSFETCVQRAYKHRLELEQIMDIPPTGTYFEK